MSTIQLKRVLCASFGDDPIFYVLPSLGTSCMDAVFSGKVYLHFTSYQCFFREASSNMTMREEIGRIPEPSSSVTEGSSDQSDSQVDSSIN